MSSESQYFFPPFRLDPLNVQLWKGAQKISLRPKTFEVLCYLVEHSGQLVTKSALLDAVWAEVTVGDLLPANSVKELRRALGDDARSPRFIETVHRRGYRFIATVTTTTAPEQRREPSDEPYASKPIMVGRETELAQLRRWYSASLRHRRQVVFVAGEPGIGKTTFVNAFLDSVACEGAARIGRGQCIEQYGASEPYMPVLEALSRLGHEQTGERVIDLLRNFAPIWLAQMPGLLTREERARLQIEIQGATQLRMLREITEALEAIAAESPLVLLLEDLHWSDFSTLGLISAIARRSESARLLIVGTYRPGEVLATNHPLRTIRQELALHHYCEEMRLRLLSESEVEDYLSQRIGGDNPSQFGTLAPAIHAHTDGNPLFIVNLVDYLLEDAGFVVNAQELSEAEWAEKLRANRLGGMRSIREMIERKLEHLKPEDQEVLHGASIAGVEFSAAVVAAALERPQEEIEACCARLSRQEQFVSAQESIRWPDGTVAAGFRFHHTLYREVLYDRLPPGLRLELHRRIALREETGYDGRADEIASQLAHHYSRANDQNKAIQYFRLAGERAVARGAMIEAEDQYRRALILVAELPKTTDRDRLELTLCVALGVVLRSSRSWAHSDRYLAYTRAQELAEQLGETSQLVEVLLGLGITALGTGRIKAARGIGERMVAVAERSGSRAELCAAHTFLGHALMYRAQHVDAQKHLELGNSYYDEHDPRWFALSGIDAPAVLAIVVLLLGFPEQARHLFDQALHRSKSRNDRFRLGTVHMLGAIISELLHDIPSMLEQAQALRQLAAMEPVCAGLAALFTSRASMMQSNWKEGGSYLDKAAKFFKTVDLKITWAKLYESELLAAQGQVDQALSIVADVVDNDERLHLKSRALGLRARLLTQNGAGVLTVEAAYHAAVECAKVQGARYLELLATTDFARWLSSQSRSAEAHTLLREIYDWFTEGFETLALTEARNLLDELARR